MKQTEPANYINHVFLVLDESYSMSDHVRTLPAVVDGQIAYLARRSTDMDQETRITVYTFNSRGTARCLIYDKDVLRVPSIAGLYRPDGATALIDTTLLALDDLAMTPEKYGEHAFLGYVLTDGEENQGGHPSRLAARISRLEDHWTLAAFVPDQRGVFNAKSCGFPAANIAVWDATSPEGIAEVGETMRRTSESFMEGRTRGVRGSRSLFQLNDVSARDVTSLLPPLTTGSYVLYDVGRDGRIDEFVAARTGHAYQNGRAYYQLMKTETIQPQKEIAIEADGRIYTGAAARSLLGLPADHVRVKPGQRADCTIFVQSTSYNRRLIAGTRLLVLR